MTAHRLGKTKLSSYGEKQSKQLQFRRLGQPGFRRQFTA